MIQLNPTAHESTKNRDPEYNRGINISAQDISALHLTGMAQNELLAYPDKAGSIAGNGDNPQEGGHATRQVHQTMTDEEKSDTGFVDKNEYQESSEVLDNNNRDRFNSVRDYSGIRDNADRERIGNTILK